MQSSSSDNPWPQQPLDTTVRVEAPEKIEFEYQTVGPFSRLMAYLLDLMIVVTTLIGIAVVISLLAWLAVSLTPLLNFIDMGEIGPSLTGLYLVFCFVSFWFYGAICETYRNGQTFGKSLMRIQVLSVDGYAIDGVQAMIRNLFRYVDIFPVIPASVFVLIANAPVPNALPSCLIGLICMTFSSKFQRVGDLLAGTMVVVVKRKWVPDLAQFSDPRVKQLAAMIPQDFPVSANLAKTLASFVESSDRFGPELGNEIAAPLAIPLLEKLNFATNTDYTLLLSALYYRTYSGSAADQDTIDTAMLFNTAAGQDVELVDIDPLGQLAKLETNSNITESSTSAVTAESVATPDPAIDVEMRNHEEGR